ncbi:hypothetical protein [Bartonella doshiae]|uniref:Conjugal transfer protein TrbH n=2 Tax=Bartonella doshiae TaxID=33044 RepID=A0A380ZFE4_BARDO|nr:hypothetical protein [Bartonella doshiae]EJF80556.1 hypothetical protein MCS_01206 [Bartonella doshiae NCTC 12862 = ATCC 700133]MBB6158867.1 hypothetical protein [Bartonella doshiae]SUV45669.1 conjugal transfer protein TrbH [Bartonella doshiae]
MLKYLLLPPLVLTAGCTSVNGYSSSYVGPGLTKNAAKLIAHDYISNIKNRLPPATTTLIIQKNNTADNFTPLFVSLLRRNGYRVIHTDQPQKQKNMGVNLIYILKPKDNGRIISVLQYDWAGEPSYHISTFENR